MRDSFLNPVFYIYTKLCIVPFILKINASVIFYYHEDYSHKSNAKEYYQIQNYNAAKINSYFISITIS